MTWGETASTQVYGNGQRDNDVVCAKQVVKIRKLASVVDKVFFNMLLLLNYIENLSIDKFNSIFATVCKSIIFPKQFSCLTPRFRVKFSSLKSRNLQ